MRPVRACWRWIVRECTDQLHRLRWIEDHYGRFGAGLVPAVSLAGPFGAAIGSRCWWVGLLVAAILWPTVWIMFRDLDLTELEEPATSRTDDAGLGALADSRPARGHCCKCQSNYRLN